jgi:pimeloyl-ACP methyl ester carboxylesterase
MQLIYLHGFASSPGSNKAQKFRRALADRGVVATVPDLNQGDFTGMTLSRQAALLERLTADSPPRSAVLVGSSMGAYVSALFAARSDRVAALVLMAPAFGFIERWIGRMSQEALAEWERRGSMMVFHYATEEMTPIGWGLVEDARTHPAYPDIGELPALVFHGLHDESVPVDCSRRFAEDRPSVTLRLLDDDHSLAQSADGIIDESFEFLATWFPELGKNR